MCARTSEGKAAREGSGDGSGDEGAGSRGARGGCEEQDGEDGDGQEGESEEEDVEDVDEVTGYHFMESVTLFVAYMYVNSGEYVRTHSPDVLCCLSACLSACPSICLAFLMSVLPPFPWSWFVLLVNHLCLCLTLTHPPPPPPPPPHTHNLAASKVFDDRLVNKGLSADFPDFEAVYHLVVDAVDSYNEQWENAFKLQEHEKVC